MSTKRLLMVTTGFPYGHGESFVAAELDHIRREFGDVTLVPCVFSPAEPPRQTPFPIELAYARARWGAGRFMHVAASFMSALSRYKWLDEAAYIMGRPRRLENIKELVRCLYRARLFEQFLDQQNRQGRRYDMIYFYWIIPEIAGALAFRQRVIDAARKPFSVVARAHGGDLYEELRPGGYAGLTDSIIAGLDAVYCISQHGKNYLNQKYPQHAANFHLARLGVDDPGFISPQPQEKALSILSCSFMVPGKRLHRIAEAIDFLLNANPTLQVRWTHIGNGDLFEELEAMVARLLTGRHVQVDFKGYMRQADIIALYRHAAFDVIVNVSDTEGIPVSLMEASSVGIPMVATNVGGSSEIVNAANGVLIDEDADTATIAAALMRFHDRSVALRYRTGARHFWQTHFNARTNYIQFGKSLQQCMEAS